MEEIENGWYLLPKQKIIARKPIPFLSALAARLGFRRTRPIDLYSMIKRAYHSPNNMSKMMAYSFPMEHDNFPKPDQYPSYFRLTGGWTLDKKSAIFLKDGPLFSENTTKVLVHSRIFVRSFLQQVWRLLPPIAVILGILVSLLRLMGVI